MMFELKINVAGRTNNMTLSVKKYSVLNPKGVAFGSAADTAARLNINSKSIANGLKWAQEKIAAPHQRLILGATALSSQPFIDLNNKKVDERTRQVSCAKTLAKILVGTTVGVSVRAACLYLTKNYTKVDEMGRKAAKNSFLVPSVMKNFTKNKHIQYVNAIGAIMGVLTCLFTNFLIDAPLTKYFTNKFSARIDEKFKAKAKGGKQ